MMKWYFAKFLQLMGMSLLASALYFGMAQNNMNMEVKLLLIGSIVFVVGWMVEGKSEQ